LRRGAEAPLYLNSNGNGTTLTTATAKNRLVECFHSHLSGDKAIAKMGHPLIRGRREKSSSKGNIN
jgi:hypothetical protein